MKHITVRSKPLQIVTGTGIQCVKVMDACIATKRGMDVRVRSDEMIIPDAEVCFYVKLQYSWRRSDGSFDYDEFVTDGEDYYIAFRPLGKVRIEFTATLAAVIDDAIKEFVAEITT